MRYLRSSATHSVVIKTITFEISSMSNLNVKASENYLKREDEVESQKQTPNLKKKRITIVCALDPESKGLMTLQRSEEALSV